MSAFETTAERHDTALEIIRLAGHYLFKDQLLPRNETKQAKWRQEGGRICVLNQVFHSEGFDKRGRYLPLLVPHFTLQFHVNDAEKGELLSFITFTPHDATLESSQCEKAVIKKGVATYPEVFPGDVWDVSMAHADYELRSRRDQLLAAEAARQANTG